MKLTIRLSVVLWALSSSSALAQVPIQTPSYYLLDTHAHPLVGKTGFVPGHLPIVETDGKQCLDADIAAAPGALTQAPCAGKESYDYVKLLELMYQNMVKPVSSPIKRILALGTAESRPFGWSSAAGLCPTGSPPQNCDEVNGYLAARFPGNSTDERLIAARGQLSAQQQDAIRISIAGFGACDTSSSLGHVAALAPQTGWAGEMYVSCWEQPYFGDPSGPTPEVKAILQALGQAGAVLSSHFPLGSAINYKGFDTTFGKCAPGDTACARFKAAIKATCDAPAEGGAGVTLLHTHGYVHFTGTTDPTEREARKAFLRYWFNQYDGQGGRGAYVIEAQYLTPGAALQSPYNVTMAKAVPDDVIDFMLEGTALPGLAVVSEHVTIGSHIYPWDDFTPPATMGKAYEQLSAYWDEVFRRMYGQGVALGKPIEACQAVQNMSHGTAEKLLGIQTLPDYVNACNPAAPRVLEVSPNPVAPGEVLQIKGEGFTSPIFVILRDSAGDVFGAPVQSVLPDTITVSLSSTMPENRYEVLLASGLGASAPYRNLLVAFPPQILDVTMSPSPAPAGSAIELVIDGAHFHGGYRVALSDPSTLAELVVLPESATRRTSESQILARVPTTVVAGTYAVKVTNVTSFDAFDGRLAIAPAAENVTLDLGTIDLVDEFPRAATAGAVTNTEIHFHLRAPSLPIDPADVSVALSTLQTYQQTVYPDDGQPHKDLYYRLVPTSPIVVGLGETIDVQVFIANGLGIFLSFSFTTDGPPTYGGDGDSLPDEWEQAVGLDKLSAEGRNGDAGDPDRDGVPNVTEYSLGTNPADYEAVLAGAGPDPANPTAGRAYYSGGVVADDRVKASGPTAGILGLVSWPKYRFGVDVAAINVDGERGDALVEAAGPTDALAGKVIFYRNGYRNPAGKQELLPHGLVDDPRQVSVAAGDLDGDGIEELVTAAPITATDCQMRVWKYDPAAKKLNAASPSFSVRFPCKGDLRVNVTTGDFVLTDGETATGPVHDEILTGSAVTSTLTSSMVRGWKLLSGGISGLVPIPGLAFNPTGYLSTVPPSVAAGNTHRNIPSAGKDPRFDEIYVGKGPDAFQDAVVKGWSFLGGSRTGVFNRTITSLPQSYGIRIALTDFDSDGYDELLVAPGPTNTDPDLPPVATQVEVYDIDDGAPARRELFTTFYDVFGDQGANVAGINQGSAPAIANIKTSTRLASLAALVRASPVSLWETPAARDELAGRIEGILASLTGGATNVEVAEALRAVQHDAGHSAPAIVKDAVLDEVEGLLAIYEGGLVPSPGVVAEVAVPAGPADMALSIVPPASAYVVSQGEGGVDRVDLGTLAVTPVQRPGDPAVPTVAEDVTVTPGGKVFIAGGRRLIIRRIGPPCIPFPSAVPCPLPRCFLQPLSITPCPFPSRVVTQIVLGSPDDPSQALVMGSYSCGSLFCQVPFVADVLVVPAGGTAPAGRVYVAVAVSPIVRTDLYAIDGVDDLSTATVTLVASLPTLATQLALSPIAGDGRLFLATREGVAALDTLTGSLQPEAFPFPVTGMALARLSSGQAVGHFVDVSGTLTSVDLESGAVLGSLALAGRPVRVAITPDRALLVVSLQATDDVAIVARDTLSLLRRVPVGEAPFDVLAAPDSSEALVSNTGGSTVSVVLLQARSLAPVVEGVGTAIKELPDAVFEGSAAERRVAFEKKVSVVASMVRDAEAMPEGPGRDGLLHAARKKLENDVLARADGSLGGNPANDWIHGAEPQRFVQSLLLQVLRALDALEAPEPESAVGDAPPEEAPDAPEGTLP